MRLFSACIKLFSFARIKVFLFAFLIAFLFPVSIFAHGDQQYPTPTGGEINKALEVLATGRILPDNPLYFLITIKEFFSRLFQPSAAQRAEFDFVLSGKRLKESYLMFETGDNDLAVSNLLKYQKRLAIMVTQLKRARSQNQDITEQINKISDDLFYHQTLLLAIISKKPNIDETADLAINGFVNALEEVDKIEPGVKDRYKIFRNMDTMESSPSVDLEPSPTASPSPSVSTPSARPRRIIY